MKQKKRMKEGLIPHDHTLTGDSSATATNTSPLSQNNTDSNGSLDGHGLGGPNLDGHGKSESPGPQWPRDDELPGTAGSASSTQWQDPW